MVYNVVVAYYVEAANCFSLFDVTNTHVPLIASDACRTQSVISINIRRSPSPLSWLRGEGGVVLWVCWVLGYLGVILSTCGLPKIRIRTMHVYEFRLRACVYACMRVSVFSICVLAST